MWCWTGTTPGVFLIHSRAAPWHIRADVCRLVWKTQWWLGVCGNLTGLKDTQIASKIFLSVSVTVSPEGINVGINKLDRDYPHQCGWASSNLVRTWIEAGRGRVNLLFLSWDIQLSAFGHWRSWTLGLRFTSPTWFSGLQTWAELLHLSSTSSEDLLYILLVLFFWGTRINKNSQVHCGTQRTQDPLG